MRTPLEIETEFSDRSTLDEKKSFHLVGIGGAGMSGIARMLKNRGFEVKGTDSSPSQIIESLASEGITIAIGHTGDLVKKGDALILTDAIDLKSSPEVQKARELGCDIYRRSQVLGWLLQGKKTIAVTGTHGKTTTTGMIGAGLQSAGFDPTIVVGAEVPEFGGAIIEGNSDWAVIEACEAYDSIRDFDPYIVVLTNLELDHIDFHVNWEGLRDRVLNFVHRVPEGDSDNGIYPGLVYCSEDAGAKEIATLSNSTKCIPYGSETFSDLAKSHSQESIEMSSPGLHNRLNAGAALSAISITGADLTLAIKGVADFRGAERRLQVLYEGDITVIDDYAHHPTEITASLQAIRERWLTKNRTAPQSETSVGTQIEVQNQLEARATNSGQDCESGRLIVVFQPHLYSRTEPLIKEFAVALSDADLVVLTDIYPAREVPIAGVSSFRIAEAVSKPCLYVPQRHLLPRKVGERVAPGDVVVAMGAGNISEFGPKFVEEWMRRSQRMGQKPSVAVVCGGDSAEREISLLSGRAVESALKKKGYDVARIDISEMLLTGANLMNHIDVNRPDVCFLTVHGTNAEDGAIQGLFELIHLPYTGSGIQSNAIAMDKNLTKQILQSNGIPMPQGVLLRKNEIEKHVKVEACLEIVRLGGAVVKPNQQGSTVGLSFVESVAELDAAIEFAFQFGNEVLVEEWLRGIEISVPVLGDHALPPVEIVPNEGAYDFANKYTPGATVEICPARISIEQTELASSYAVRAHQALGCRGCTRTDMMVLPDKIVCLEINTLPGMTSTSLVPNSARSAGIEFEDLCEWMVNDALKKA